MTAVLEARQLTHRFGGVVAVNGLDLSVEEGAIHGVIGPNGSGKSTLLNVVSGIYTLTSGEVVFRGQRVERMSPHRLVAAGIARTFQNIRLFPRLSVLENVQVGQYCRTRSGVLRIFLADGSMRREEARARDRARAALALVGLADRVDARPADLPYGQQRLVEIARALATEPRLLLLDEPAAGMTFAERRRLAELVRGLRHERELSVIVVEHDLSLIGRLCDGVTVLNFGRKIAEGALAKVREEPAVVEAYLGRRRAGADRY